MQFSSFIGFGLLLLGVAGCTGASQNSKSNFPKEVKNVRVDDPGKRRMYPPCEPSIAISQKDPKIVVAGAILDYVYRSEDGGKTWTTDQLESEYGVFGDPCIASDKEGAFYYLHLSDPAKKGWASEGLLDRIVIQKSDDDGKTWSNGSYMGLRPPADQDKHWIGIDANSKDLYVTWTEFDKYNSTAPEDKSRILFSSSTDGGTSWSEAKAINQFDGNCLDDDMTPEGAVPTVGPNGEVYVSWSYDNKIWFDKSTDGGKTWMAEDIEVSEQIGGWAFDIPGLQRANGMPITSADVSNGPNRGNIYINWCDQRNGDDDTDVYVARSTDQGKTWSPGVRVNNDKPGAHQFFTWMAVDPVTGHIYTVFYDRRMKDGIWTEVYLGRSVDGGQTFTNHKISESPFKTSSLVFFGDYNNISAYNGVVRPIWTRYEKGELSVWTALIDLPAGQ